MLDPSVTQSTETTTMSIAEIARIIDRDWRPVNYAAKPYLEAMFSLETLDSKYGLDDGSSIVAYFLSNASTWRGPVARGVKRELKRRLDARYKARRR